MLNRDTSGTGEFVYAREDHAASTAARPAPSRRPLRKNVLFFATTAAAREAGFRACKRCRPDERRESQRQPDQRSRA